MNPASPPQRETSAARGGFVLLAVLVFVLLLSMVTATGAYNWRRVLPTAGTPTSTRLLRRSASAEALIAVAAIVVSAVLVATPLPTMP